MLNSAERQWYVVYSKPQREDYAQFHLRAKGLETFFPKLLLPEPYRSQRRAVPLFPNYLFVKLRLLSDEYNYATWSPGVRRIVSFNGTPASIDSDTINFLMQQTTQDGLITARSNLTPGQEIKIDGGPLEGLIGIIQEPPDAKGRVKILLNLLNRPTRVEVPVRYIKAEWVVAGSPAGA